MEGSFNFETSVNEKLPEKEKLKLVNKYSEHGLSSDQEYFIINNKDGSETRFHAWANIPYSSDGKTIEKTISIEKYIQEKLGLVEEDGESKQKEVA